MGPMARRAKPASTAASPDKAKKTEISAATKAAIPPELLAQVAAIRSSVRENFGKAAMAMMMLPRYRGQTIGDLQHLLLDPLLRDRLAIAYPGAKAGEAAGERDMLGFAIWASVSEEADQRIREQIRAGVFPVRLKPEDWNSGMINWLLDVVAANEEATLSVIANFRQVVKEGSLALHPMITRLVKREALEKLGATKLGDANSAPQGETIN